MRLAPSYTDSQFKYMTMLGRVAENVIPVANAKMAACLVRKNRVIAVGVNKKVSHPLQKKYSSHPEKIFLHAEIDCILNAVRAASIRDLRESIMYVARVKRPSEKSRLWVFGEARPCTGCAQAIKDYGIKEILYT